MSSPRTNNAKLTAESGPVRSEIVGKVLAVAGTVLVVGLCGLFYWNFYSPNMGPFEADDLRSLASVPLDAEVEPGSVAGRAVIVAKGMIGEWEQGTGWTGFDDRDTEFVELDPAHDELPDSMRASTVDEVDVVVVVQWGYERVASYSGGSGAYNPVADVSVWTLPDGNENWANAVCRDRATFKEENPDPLPVNTGDDVLCEDHPTEDIAAYVVTILD